MKPRAPFLDHLLKHWLLVGILLCIFLASLYPKLGAKQGPLHTEISVKYGAVSLIFLISGFSLKTDRIWPTLRQYRLHLFIQLFTFVFIPFYTQFLVKLLDFVEFNSWVLKGLVTVACMPPPVSSAVILTKAANGNETAAIFNSILGSFLGILVTPMLLLLNLGSTTLVPLFGTVIQLTTTVLVPLILGQILRNYAVFSPHKIPLNTISQSALLFVIYTTFCDTFYSTETGLSAPDVLLTMFSVLFLQMTLMALAFYIASAATQNFSHQDVVAIVFCSTHKSLTLGVPILRIMFHGYAHLSLISLPLLMYHPTQIIMGGLVVSQLKDWVQMGRKRRPPV